MPNRLSGWIVVHPILWATGSGVLLVVLGSAIDLPPSVVGAVGTMMSVINIVHGRKRGDCQRRSGLGSER